MHPDMIEAEEKDRSERFDCRRRKEWREIVEASTEIEVSVEPTGFYREYLVTCYGEYGKSQYIKELLLLPFQVREFSAMARRWKPDIKIANPNKEGTNGHILHS